MRGQRRKTRGRIHSNFGTMVFQTWVFYVPWRLMQDFLAHPDESLENTYLRTQFLLIFGWVLRPEGPHLLKGKKCWLVEIRERGATMTKILVTELPRTRRDHLMFEISDGEVIFGEWPNEQLMFKLSMSSSSDEHKRF